MPMKAFQVDGGDGADSAECGSEFVALPILL
jgi:hypothetical protein